METVNRGRLRILLEDFLREGAVPSPPSVNAREPLLPVLWERERLILGAPLHRVVGSTYELKKATENNTKNYLLGIHKKKGEVCVSLREGSGSLDVLQAAFHAELLFLILNRDLSEFPMENRKLTDLQRNARAEMDDRLWRLVSDTHSVMDELWTPLLRGVSSNGWDTQREQLGKEEWRGCWGLVKWE
ncbi:RUS family member 1 [Amblyraja radiata]|uniref:RUS family member 1 n=1 Tax=Amblyraja radiata TaxID=386614 RepID=UPI001403B88A|nr:RUS family member 1 [Amblyraja radiata]